MNQTTSHTAHPTKQTMPLALLYTTRLLLSEKSSVTVDGYSLSLRTESFAMRATEAAPILKEISGYSHYGIND